MINTLNLIFVFFCTIIIVLNVIELLLFRKLEKEFRYDKGHSLRDLADRVERLLITADLNSIKIAADLADSHGRADAVDEGNPGEASDAASRSAKRE